LISIELVLPKWKSRLTSDCLLGYS